MATTLQDFTACKDGSGNVISIEFSGTTTCSDLRIEVSDESGDLLAARPVSTAGSAWHVALSVQNGDFLAGDIACDGTLQVNLKCHDSTPAELVFSDQPKVSCVDCCSITIDAVVGAPAADGSLQSLTITGTATFCTAVHVRVATSGAPVLEKSAQVSNGQWQVVFDQGATDASGALKGYNCKDTVSVDVTCRDKGSKCSASDSLPINCCPDTADVTVTGPDNFNKTNPTDAELQCLPAGNYTLKCTTPAPAYKWRSDDVPVTGADAGLQVVSVNADTMVVSLAGNDNIHFSVTAQISRDCQPLQTVAFHCGGTLPPPIPPIPPPKGPPTPPPPVNCVVSAFSPWSPCVNGQQTRTRTIITQPRNGGRRCPHLTETRPCTDIAVDLCMLWLFVNIGLMIVTALLIFLAFCSIDAATWTAIVAIFTGGALGPEGIALTATTIGLLIAAGIAVVVTLGSFIAWIFICLFAVLRNAQCNLIKLVLLIVHGLILFSAAVSAALWVIAYFTAGFTVGCAVGAGIDVAWFGTIEQIFFWIGVATGCLNFANLFGFAGFRRAG